MKTRENLKSNLLKHLTVALFLFASVALVSCNDDEDPMVPENPSPENIATSLQQISDDPDSYSGNVSELKKQTIKEKKPKFTALIKALAKSNLVSTVAQSELTVFAPTDEAFQQLFTTLGIESIDDLTAEQLTPILLYHVVAGKVMSSDLSTGLVETVNGAYLNIDVSNGVMVNDAKVEIADLTALNGVIHIIDQVLLPPSMNIVEKAISFNPEFSILVDAVVKADLAGTLSGEGPFTVFAPTNAAFEALFAEMGVSGVADLTAEQLTPILLYHVVGAKVFSMDLSNGSVMTLNGKEIEVDLTGGVMINDAMVVTADVQATNGVIHVLDKVLLPPKNIVETAIGFDPEFSILVDAVVKADLADALSGEGPFTVFAPTNAAFETLFSTLGVSGVDALTAEQLTPILLYHVVADKVMSTDLANGFIPTLNGAAIEVDLSSGVMINDANVAQADVEASNGVIHVIDQVILPPSMNLVEKAISFNPEFSILVDAVIKAELTSTLAEGGPFTVFAPTNAAFEALFEELEVGGLDDLDATTLANVLKYHVVEGRVYSSDLESGTVTTLNGSFTIDVSTLELTDANERTSSLVAGLLNVQATNGVIHVIDNVILP
ncbi:fasciclin domain-containing protein [Sunxiuqinia elliptica]|uniref:Transforming growth factor-beta-induced protein n=1 Tax=Sunxiuqinia elliptica TaxID=655355 RepID=A0A4R6HA41_9BACT|nr:fasciclin domain-containing protein [Sunxiuqinia elliptica]TDO04778.1 transforming growth factor-beta-induced protein [Sunxiuqinia elliptica]TDO64325.1 transforming growth factor-beta-induced protein [Sunxiuqinia elliptica]